VNRFANTDSTVLPQAAAWGSLPWIGHESSKRSWVSEYFMGTYSDPHDRFFILGLSLVIIQNAPRTVHP
jgi:hypothetical protein